MILLFPASIKFKSREERDRFAPDCHMFYGQRCVDVPDGLPKWKGMSDDSALIEDSPEGAKKEYEEKMSKDEEVEADGEDEGDNLNEERARKRQKIGGEEKHYDLR